MWNAWGPRDSQNDLGLDEANKAFINNEGFIVKTNCVTMLHQHIALLSSNTEDDQASATTIPATPAAASSIIEEEYSFDDDHDVENNRVQAASSNVSRKAVFSQPQPDTDDNEQRHMQANIRANRSQDDDMDIRFIDERLREAYQVLRPIGFWKSQAKNNKRQTRTILC